MLALGCGPSEADTRLLVVVASDLGAPPITRLIARTLDAEDEPIDRAVIAVGADAGGHALPLSFVVVPRDPDVPVRIEVEATDADGASLVLRRVRATVPRGTTRVVHVLLEGCCSARGCDGGLTCVGGDCVPEDVEALPLTDDARGAELAFDASFPTCEQSDGGSDGGTPMDATTPIDARPTPTCPGETCTCASTCQCEDRGTCTWTGDTGTLECGQESRCTADAGDSTAVRCNRSTLCTITLGQSSNTHCDRATCVIEVGSSSNVTCADRSTCTITCRDTCNVDCRGATHCSLRCGDAAANDVTDTAQCP
ncbi:Hypothetical protein I5071_85450 [Sandaracinus amylolyticus]|nr:Hypothetical protein I5071_85450 [Sandaracinus amylolyticus]